MDYINSTLLPFILDLICREDNLCTTVEDLTKAVKDAVMAEYIRPFGSLDLAIRFALEVGSNMGILTLTDEVFTLPFNFNPKKPASKKRYTVVQGRKAVKRELAKCRAKPKSKAKASIYKRNTKGAGQNKKVKAKKRM